MVGRFLPPPPLLLVTLYRKVIKTIEVKYIVINDIPQGNHNTILLPAKGTFLLVTIYREVITINIRYHRMTYILFITLYREVITIKWKIISVFLELYRKVITTEVAMFSTPPTIVTNTLPQGNHNT